MLLVAVVAASGIAMAVTDQAALAVGGVFLTVVVTGGLGRLYRYTDVGALLLGSAAYAVLEQHRGTEGIASWVAATMGFTAAVAAVRFLNLHIGAVERRVQRTDAVVEELTMIDATSELLKRRYGELAIAEEVSRARRTHTAVTLVLIAADPVHEHAVDAAPDEEEEASAVGALLRDNLRGTDRLMRLSRTLFATILPATSGAGGSVVAEKINAQRDRYGCRPLRCAVATFPAQAVSAQELLHEAEAALQLARAADLSVITPAMLQQVSVAT
jgi:GGDEF domain-containing protein